MKRAQAEGIGVVVLDRSGDIRTEVDAAALLHHLSNPRSLIWCEVREHHFSG